MKMVSITDNSHREITKEIKQAKKKKEEPVPTYGTIIDEMVNERYTKDK